MKNPEMINCSDSNGLYPIHYCVFNNSISQIQILQMLFDFGVDINSLDNDQRTPLHYAALHGKSRAVHFLMKKNARTTIRDNVEQKTAIEMSCNDRIREIMIAYQGGVSSNFHKKNLKGGMEI